MIVTNDIDKSRCFYDAVLAMASKVSTLKPGKMIEEDDTVQASIADVLMNARLINDAARTAGIASPLLDRSLDLFARTDALGSGINRPSSPARTCCGNPRTW
jgi:3-hydroxyisobutyrate dehydrogenase-like beta-hydroxyacid dehydrogenase